MKVGDLVKIKGFTKPFIGIVVKQVPNLEKFHDTRFRIATKHGDYEVQSSSKYWEVISEKG